MAKIKEQCKNMLRLKSVKIIRSFSIIYCDNLSLFALVICCLDWYNYKVRPSICTPMCARQTCLLIDVAREDSDLECI